MTHPTLKMYADLAAWWPLLSPPEDYADEAAFYSELLTGAGLPLSPSLMELGSGGGSNAYYMKKRFARVTLTDLSPGMLAISQALNPECEHLPGDMRSLQLERRFDVVFVHDAIDYMTTLDDLHQALETASIHCEPGGLALFAPDHVEETFEPGTDHGGTDGNGRSLRYLEWTYDPDPEDGQYSTEYVYLLREGDQPAIAKHERHICGLFPRAEWLRLLRETGLQPEIVTDHYDRELFLARKPIG